MSHFVRDWAPVGSTAFAAVAATASWSNIRQSRLHWLAAQAPVLTLQVQDNQKEARLEVHIGNVGAGLARGLRICLILGNEYIEGYAGPIFGGLLKTDEMRVVQTQLSDRAAKPIGVVTCLDSAGRVHSFDFAGGHRTRRARSGSAATTDPLAALKRHYRKADLPQRKVPATAERKQASP